ncbi:MAG: alpha/beta hydrolase [Nostoc sp.]|uniref:alpha/beta fold hydrolase n=1 Tax=Nostoc sp. TaxID=1180 RepID=UPI002FF6CDD1
MFIPLGFVQRSVLTSLGKMTYYTNQGELWATDGMGDTPSDTLPERETLIFFHGIGGGASAYGWSKVYPAFAAEYRVLAPDLIGWGRSDHPEQNYLPGDYILMLIEFIEKTCEGPATIIASSLTGAFAIRAAIERPDLFKSLILTLPSGIKDFRQYYSNSFFAQIASIPILDRVLYAGQVSSFGIRDFFERVFAQPNRLSPEIVEAFVQSAQQPNAEYAALSFLQGSSSFDLSEYIPKLTTPTIFIWGSQAKFTGPEVGRRLANLNPQAIQAFIELEDVGLNPELEVPEVIIGLIRKFLPVLRQ